MATQERPPKSAGILSAADRAESTALAQANLILTRDEIREEPSSKARENRLRVAFLSTKGNTMAMWEAQREDILTSDSG